MKHPWKCKFHKIVMQVKSSKRSQARSIAIWKIIISSSFYMVQLVQQKGFEATGCGFEPKYGLNCKNFI